MTNRSPLDAYNMTNRSPLQKNEGFRFHPIPELQTPANDMLTVVLIQNSLIFYPEESHDPVFPAHHHNAWGWFNGNFTGGVLACIDQAMICKPNNGTCTDLWDPSAGYVDGSIVDPAINLLTAALMFSTTAISMTFRYSGILDAEAKMQQAESLPLAREQWKVEARQLFETSLARMQINARIVARGLDAAESPREGLKPEDMFPFQGICQVYKFRSVGWKNISVGGVILCVVGGLLLIVCSVRAERDGDELLIESLPGWVRSRPQKELERYERSRAWIGATYKALKTIWVDRRAQKRRDRDRRLGVTTVGILVDFPLQHLNHPAPAEPVRT
jgi:hypothetical protein